MSDQGNLSAPECSGPCQSSPQLQLYQTIIFATPVLFALLLVVLFCLLYVRRRQNAHMSSQGRLQFITRGFFPASVADQGLTKSFRERLPVVAFDDKFAALNQDSQCAVCLSDYQRNEKLQQLPPCKHSFHVSCIDEWLAKNTTCPICRTSLLHEASVGRGVTARPENFRRWENGVVINDFQDVVALRRAVDALGGASSSMNVSSLENAPPFSTDHSVSIERS